MDYPKWKYSADSSVVVESTDAEAELAGAWFDSPADVPAPVIVPTEDEQLLLDAKAEKEALLAAAEARGIVVDKRFGIAKLKELLA